MPHVTLEQLRSLDLALLTEIVRQDQRSPAFDIGEWQVDRLSSKGIVNPDGLFLFHGNGRDWQGSRPWSVVLKIIHRPDEDRNPRDIWYWKRELLAVQHNLLAALPGPMKAPRYYDVIEHEDDGWIWMEHIKGARAPTTLADYAFTAREIGRSNGAALLGLQPPDYPWLCTEHCRWWLASIETLEPEKAWENRFVRDAFSAALRPRVERLWAEKEAFLAALDRLPQLFSHFDTQRRNLFIRRRDDGSDEIVAVDWAQAGCGALGGDLVALVGMSAMLFEVEPEDVLPLEAVAEDASLSGLRDAGWTGDADLARLGYTAGLALSIGAAAPAAAAAWTSDPTAVMQQFDRGPEVVAAGWAKLCAWALDRADDARRLMDRLGPG